MKTYPGIEALAFGRPWAIMPEKLEVISAFLTRWLAGERYSEEELQQRFGAAERRQPMAGQGIAILPVYGVISQRINLLSAISGGTSVELLTRQFREAQANPDVGTIVFDIDSPGGSVAGVPELAAEIAAARGGEKRSIAVANSLAASAAYWIGSSADEFVAAPSAEVGSIGVYALHRDLSGMMEKAGVKDTIIRAGKYKVEMNPSEPLTEEARAYAQSVVDEFYQMFTARVASNRNVKRSEVVNGFGQGRVLTAKAALAEGMIDRIATLDDVLTKRGVSRPPSRRNFALERKRLELAG